MAARYNKSRDDFLQSASKAGWHVESIEHPRKGPAGISIYLDIAQAGNRFADDLLMISSGTHGIEGYLGSDIQTRLLQEGVLDASDEKRHLALVHGVNPYGFAWHRRVNEDNVDLNRNFIDFDAPLPVNDSYAKLDDTLNPKTWSSDQAEKLGKTIDAMIERLGLPVVFQAISGGQYNFPDGVQYGGQGPTWSRTILTNIWKQMMEGKNRAINLDLHSGLGECGTGVIMTYGEETQSRIRRARSMWGDLFLSPPADGPGVITKGVVGPYLEGLCPKAEVLAVVLEFGTQPPEVVSRNVAADNWLHVHGDIDTLQGQEIKQGTLDAFYIDEIGFREMVYQRAKQVVSAT